MTPARIARAILVLLACPLACAAAPRVDCRLVEVASWPVRLERNLPVTAGAINGERVGVMIDTGSAATIVTKTAAARLGLATRTTSERMAGIGGDSRLLVTRLNELRVGDMVRADLRVHVAGERPIPGVDVILGEDFLRAVDVEFDYAKQAVRLFRAEACESGAWLAYWDKGAQVLPIAYESGSIRVPVAVNGREASAMVDSGAANTMVSLELAYGVGVTRDAPGVHAASCAAGIGAGVLPSWVGRFDSLRLGAETIRNPRLAFADFAFGDDPPWVRAPQVSYSRRSPDLLLGADFLRTHRVLVANSQDRLYFTYLGGTVFPESPAGGCSERLR
jgi:clan AA aspartic protease (TIGR02281 family)